MNYREGKFVMLQENAVCVEIEGHNWFIEVEGREVSIMKVRKGDDKNPPDTLRVTTWGNTLKME